MTPNADLLREIADTILSKPKRYYQGSWEGFHTVPAVYELQGSRNPADVDALAAAVDPAAPCGSTFCIAGWAVALTATTEEHHKAIEESCKDGLDIYNHEYALANVVGRRFGFSVSSMSHLAGHLLGVDQNLFDGTWHPAGHDREVLGNDPELVAKALYRLADGEDLAAVSDPWWAYEQALIDVAPDDYPG